MDLNKCCTIDIESNGLLSDMVDFSSLPYKLKDSARLWCVVVTNCETLEPVSLAGAEITKEKLYEVLLPYEFIIAHNGIKFDFPALQLFGVFDYEIGNPEQRDKLFGREVTFIDTLVLSRLLHPDKYGGHGLEVWGERLGVLKTDFRGLCVEKGYIDAKAPKGAEFLQYVPEMESYCITPDMRLLGEDLRWKPASEFFVGDNILGFEEHVQLKRGGRRYQSSEIQIITKDFAEVFEVKLKSGKILKVTKEHKFLVSHSNHGHNRYCWVETKDLVPKTERENCSKLPCMLPVYEQETSFEAGWLSGMFDGEGWLTNGKGRPHSIGIAQRPTATLDKLESLLNFFGVNVSKRYVNNKSDCIKLGVIRGFNETYRLLSMFRPERLVTKMDFNSFGRLEMKGRAFNDEVLEVNSIGVQEILKIQTSSSTFMCEGYPMHNCTQDTLANVAVFTHLWEQFIAYPGWRQAMRMESKLADLGLRREMFGFWFDRDLAVKCVEELTELMEEHKNKVNPLLPPKPMNKTELKPFTPPKNQLTKAGALTSHMRKFLERLETEAQVAEDMSMAFEYDGKVFPIPCPVPVKTHTEPDISNLNHVKTHLINLGWDPTEWRERDLTKDAKKVNLSFEKRVEALDRYLEQTLQEGLYKKQRLEILDLPESSLRDSLVERLKGDFPVRVPTSPSVRVGVAKEVCPNIIKVGEKVEFANDFSLYLTYKHRKSSIAGGQLEDVDYDEEYPTSGFLANYRQEDHRIPTPAIEIGATTFRYRHISITNIPRSSSVYGEKMRSLFGPGEGGVQLGFDFSSLEARIQGHYCWNYTDGQKLAKTLLAEKPLDIHTVTGLTLGLPRSDAKSVNYMLIYGGKIPKVKSMLGVDNLRATEIFNLFWDSMPALKELKQAILEHWLENDKKFITGIDGRRVMTRSEHSLLNSAFQSAGVIAAKYVTVFMLQELETLGYNTNPFKGLPDVCSMLEMHDECQLFVKKNIPTFKTFESEEDAEEFVKKWQGEGQLSAISHGKSWYVCLPNPVSLAIGKAIKRTEELLKLNVELGYEWIVSNNWHGCH